MQSDLYQIRKKRCIDGQWKKYETDDDGNVWAIKNRTASDPELNRPFGTHKQLN
ncbi:hypothetical protein CHA01nite_34770 [Chryseobacterium hagamense]|uniref:Uncharacterized protein n=1 Tax=Chryseobacterium hagamense TaxID=395935 RepID=A0A511YRC1_9FLAO|nr:hypothetical protein CHA01nite_34770 [Chryseobacterium hagamense]